MNHLLRGLMAASVAAAALCSTPAHAGPIIGCELGGCDTTGEVDPWVAADAAEDTVWEITRSPVEIAPLAGPQFDGLPGHLVGVVPQVDAPDVSRDRSGLMWLIFGLGAVIGATQIDFGGGGGDSITPPGSTPPGTVNPVPEPSTWLMLLMGFLGLGLVLRCNRRMSCVTQS